MARSWAKDKDGPDIDGISDCDEFPPDTADDPAPLLPADKVDGKVICAAGATDRSTAAAVAGVKKTKARKPVVRTVGIKSSFLI